MNHKNCSLQYHTYRPALVRISKLGLLFLVVVGTYRLASSQSGTIREFSVNGSPVDITPGSDGNIWFTELGGDKIGRLTKDGAVTEFPVRTPMSFPHGITAGPDANIWFTEINASQIGRITMAGQITEFPLPTADCQPHDITAGPDGNLWFTEISCDRIGRITPNGAVTEFPLSTAGQKGSVGPCGPSTAVSQPYVITAGPDSNLWFTECNSNKIGRISTAGEITEFPLPIPNSQPHGITMGPRASLWFTEFAANKIGIISTNGVILEEVPVPTVNSGPHDITTGPDHKLWFAELSANQIGSISSTREHTIVEIPVPESTQSAFGNLFAIARDHLLPTGAWSRRGDDQQSEHDGSIWFVELGTNKIGELQ